MNMSNMEFAQNIRSFADCEEFLSNAPLGRVYRSKKLTYATTVSDSINWATGRPYRYTVTHHDTAIATFYKVADVLYIPKWTDTRENYRYANVYGIDQFEIVASFDNGGYTSQTTANRLHKMIPRYAPAGLCISTRTREVEDTVYGWTHRDKVMVAHIDGYEYPFDTLHFSLAGDVIAYHNGRVYRVAQRPAEEFRKD